DTLPTSRAGLASQKRTFYIRTIGALGATRPETCRGSGFPAWLHFVPNPLVFGLKRLGRIPRSAGSMSGTRGGGPGPRVLTSGARSVIHESRVSDTSASSVEGRPESGRRGCPSPIPAPGRRSGGPCAAGGGHGIPDPVARGLRTADRRRTGRQP